MRTTARKAYLALLLSVSMGTLAVAAEDKQADSTAAAPAAATKPASSASKPHWSWQPVQAQFVPIVKQKEWTRSPLDAFVIAKIEAKGLAPSPDADRGTFIRRATLDAWGVVPTPEQVDAFVKDP
mgnify:CR=1 FL=1